MATIIPDTTSHPGLIENSGEQPGLHLINDIYVGNARGGRNDSLADELGADGASFRAAVAKRYGYRRLKRNIGRLQPVFGK
jgi:hypothetical protein